MSRGERVDLASEELLARLWSEHGSVPWVEVVLLVALAKLLAAAYPEGRSVDAAVERLRDAVSVARSQLPPLDQPDPPCQNLN